MQGPDSIVLTVEPITISSQGITYRVERTTLVARRVSEAPGKPPPASPRAGYQFSRKGRLWEVVFASRPPFYLENTLGARYLNYLLHHENEGISAFELELKITPEKAKARSRTSFQPVSDAQAKREYRAALRESEAKRRTAQAAGNAEEVERLSREIRALELEVKEDRKTADTGERARDNVRKALDAVKAGLRTGGSAEQAFAGHLDDQLSTGYECLYRQPEGRIWK